MPENGSVNGGAGRDSSSSSDRSDGNDNNSGGAREAKESFDRAMRDTNAKPAANNNDPSKTDDDEPGRQSGGYSGPKGVNGPSGSGLNDAARDAHQNVDRPSSPNDDGGSAQTVNAPDTPETPETDDENDRGVLDRAGDFFGGLAKDIQDFARDNPRVDSYGRPVGLVDADGIQHGDVWSRVHASGTSSDDLANQLGFTSPQDMAAAQTTDFIGDKFKEDKAAEMEAALNERYGSVPPGMQIVLANSTLPIAGTSPVAVLDDVAKVGVRNVTRVLGPVGFFGNLAIDIFESKPLADGTLKSEEVEAPNAAGEVGAGNEPPEIARQKQDGHIAGTPQHRNREKAGKPTSVFDDPKKADDLTREAWEKGEQVPNKRHGVREHEFGERIGTDTNGEVQTKVRVHQDSQGRIHGHPAGSGE